MTAPVPSDFFAQVRNIAKEEVAKFFRSGPLRNASISDGGLTIRGGFFRLLFGNVSLFHLGPVTPSLPDGTPQQGWIVRRSDGSTVLALYDANVADGQVMQALNWFDRTGHSVLADDTNSGEGLARPYLQHAFYPARFGDYLSTSSATFETIYRAELPKQQPRLRVAVMAATDNADTSGELQVLVEGQPLGTTVTGLNSSTFKTGVFGPALLPDVEYGSTMHVEVQARRTAGTGSVRIAPLTIQGMQSA